MKLFKGKDKKELPVEADGASNRKLASKLCHYEEINHDNWQQFVSDGVLTISDAYIEKLHWSGIEFEEPVVIRNCVIRNLMLNFCWFAGGLTFEQCVVTDCATDEAGGHNEGEIHIRNNVFCCLYDLFDCQFKAKVFVHHNIFMGGTTLMGSPEKPYTNIYGGGLEQHDNIGTLDVDF